MRAPVAVWRDAVRRVGRAPAILLGVWVVPLLASLPLALDLRSRIEQHLGSSLAADTALSGVNYVWWQEFMDQATGAATTFRPTIIGAAAVLDNLSAFLDNTSRPIVITGVAGAYMLIWLFLAGGIIDRYARDRATRAHGFFATSGGFFVRFLRLAIVMGIVYGCLFGIVHPWLFDAWYPRMTRDTTVESTAFVDRVALYVVFGALVAACNLILDYAKVRAVVEDRRSMLGAIVAAFRFVRHHAAATIGLYVANVGLFAVVLVLYAVIAPGAGGGGWSVWTAFLIGQLYVIARVWVKLVFWASEAALFQSRLAHAGYVAAAVPAWPDSPAAEAILRRDGVAEERLRGL